MQLIVGGLILDARKGELVVSAEFIISCSINNISNSDTFCHKYNERYLSPQYHSVPKAPEVSA